MTGHSDQNIRVCLQGWSAISDATLEGSDSGGSLPPLVTAAGSPAATPDGAPQQGRTRTTRRRSGSPRVGLRSVFGGSAGADAFSGGAPEPASPRGSSGGFSPSLPTVPAEDGAEPSLDANSDGPMHNATVRLSLSGNGDAGPTDTLGGASGGPPEANGPPSLAPVPAAVAQAGHESAEEAGAKEAIAALDALLAAHGVPPMRRGPPPGLVGAAA